MVNSINALNGKNLTPLQILQSEFCLIKLGGSLLIVDQSEVAMVLSGTKLGQIDFYNKADGTILMKRFLESQPIHCDAAKTIKDFWVNPSTHMYLEIAFSPKKFPPTTLNLWVQHLVSPKAGDWSVVKEHLRSVICSGDDDLYIYLIKYLAHMLQFPEQKPGVMVTLLGKQGTGKGMFFEILKRIWPKTTLLVSDLSQIIGQFNAVLGHNFVIIMDEAMFSGDRKSQDRMKSMITETTCQIEQKHQPSRTIESVHRFFASSNHDHFSHVEADDRRSLFIRVSDAKQGDSNYFKQLAKAINDDDVIAALVHDLLQLDLTNFNVRARPITHEHSAQKMRSLKGFDRYWHEVLTTGYLDLAQQAAPPWQSGGFIATQSMLREFKEYDKQAQRFASFQSGEIARAMTKLCPSAVATRKTIHNNQQRGYLLPSILVARHEFETAYKCKIDWGEEASQVVEFDGQNGIQSMLAKVVMPCHLPRQAQHQ